MKLKTVRIMSKGRRERAIAGLPRSACFNGEFITHEILSEKKFTKLLRKRAITDAVFTAAAGVAFSAR